MFPDLLYDIRHSFRYFSRNRSFAAAVVASLALGIGSTTAVFSAVAGLVWSPYPYKGADRMAALYYSIGGAPMNRLFMSTGEFRNLLQARSLDGAIMWDDFPVSARNNGRAEALHAGRLSPNAFSFFGLAPVIGNTFTGDYFRLSSGPEQVAVLSYRYWRERMGGLKGVLGRNLRLDNQPYTIIGVMPERFRFLNSDIYIPLTQPGGPYWSMVRLKRNVSRAAAVSELQALIRNDAHRQGMPRWKDIRIQAAGIREDSTGKTDDVLEILSTAVSLLLLIGCVNASILMIARNIGRKHQLAVQSAIGASGFRIFRQLLTESAALAAIAGIVGIALAFLFLAVILHWMPAHLLPGDIGIRVNRSALVFATVIALSSGVMAGLVPALRFAWTQFSLSAKLQARGTLGNPGERRIHSVLLACQIAVTVLMVAGAGSAVRAFVGLTQAPLGYNPRDVSTLGISLSEGAFSQWAARTAYFELLRSKLAALPQVESAAISSGSPAALPPITGNRSAIEIPGRDLAGANRVVMEMVSPEYFPTLHIPLLRGRIWTAAENARAAHVAVINETMAREYWPDSSAIGRRIKLAALKKTSMFETDSPANDQWVEIIGVSGDVRNDGLHNPVLPAVLTPFTIVTWDVGTLLIRARVPQSGLAQTTEKAIADVNPEQAVDPVSTMQERLTAAGWAREQFIAALFLLCGALALVLTGLGLFSVVSCLVSGRAREFGLRIALGASSGQILSVVLRSTAIRIAGGIACGLILIAVLNRPVAQWTSGDLWSLGSLLPGLIALVATGICAVLSPARRAAAADP